MAKTIHHGAPSKRPSKRPRTTKNPPSATSMNQHHENAATTSTPDTPSPPLTTQEQIDWIAELSESILEDPSSAFSTQQVEHSSHHHGSKTTSTTTMPSKMRQLLDLATARRDIHSEYVARMALLSLLALYQDILPSYRIRLPTQTELAVRVSKETKQLWDYERKLLQHYQQYLQCLEKTWSTATATRNNNNNNNNKPSPLAVTAMLCLCELLKAAPHFNFRSNVLEVVVRHMNDRRWRCCEEVSEACCNAVAHVFATDAQGDVALEAARMVAKMVQQQLVNGRGRGGVVHPRVLRTFLSLPLRVHVDEAQAAKLAVAAEAKKRKKHRQEADIEKELKEGSSAVDKIVLARCQSDTLQVVTLTYFRILKSDNLNADHVAELLPPTLEGLAKFAHLINIDTVVDVLAVLKTLLKRVDALPLDAALNCVLTAFETLQGPGREMKIDQKEYIMPLYSQLPRLCTETAAREHTDLALQCLHAAFIQRREYSTVRIASFAKQFCTIALHTPPTTSAPLLAFVRQLLQRYPSVHPMLENEQDVITSGQYRPDVEDPEHANPMATSAWELATLRFHVHPLVAHHASRAAAQTLLQLPAEGTERVQSQAVRDAEELYIPTKRVKKKHPLAPRQADGKNKSQIRFITPRKTAKLHLQRW